MQPDMSWLGVLEHHVRRTPNKPIALLGDDLVTYRGMAERVAALAAGLRERGIGVGDVVGLLSYNSIEFLVTMFAANHVGAIMMPINWRLAPAELRFILEHARARALVCDVALIELANEATDLLEGDLVRVCVSTDIVAGWERFSDLGAESLPTSRAQVHGDDVHRLMYTSGTTGRPKGVMITHANLAWKNYAPGLWAAVPRRSARPHHHLDDRGGCDDRHPPRV